MSLPNGTYVRSRHDGRVGIVSGQTLVFPDGVIVDFPDEPEFWTLNYKLEIITEDEYLRYVALMALGR